MNSESNDNHLPHTDEFKATQPVKVHPRDFKLTQRVRIETTLNPSHTDRIPFKMEKGRQMRLEMLYELPLQFGQAADLDALFQMIVEKVVMLTDSAKRGTLLVYRKETGKLAVRGSVPIGEPSVSHTLAERTVREGWGFIWRASDMDTQDISKSINQLGIKTGMYAPLLYQGKILGVICVDNPERSAAFLEEDLQFLLSVAHYAAGALANHLLQEDVRQNTLVMERLLTNFSPKIRSKLVEKARAGGLNPGGEKSEVTILFSDIRGFTSLTRDWDAERIVELLNDYLALLVEAIFEHDGTIDKFVGDGILTVFGSPEPDDDQHLKAVRAALAMQNAMQVKNAARESRGETTCAIGIGIHCGEVLHGFVGSAQRLEFTVIGDVVNRTSRYCSAARGGEVLISSGLNDRVSDRFVTERRMIPTKHEGDFEAFSVVAERE